MTLSYEYPGFTNPARALFKKVATNYCLPQPGIPKTILAATVQYWKMCFFSTPVYPGRRRSVPAFLLSFQLPFNACHYITGAAGSRNI